MSAVDPMVVEQIRAAARQLVRELGFLHDTLAATDCPPSVVHALLEIGAREAVGASQLADCLQLEKSSVSRMLRKLIAAGELRARASAEDGRVKQLRLSARGRRTVQGIHAFARGWVQAALAPLPASPHADIGRGLARYAAALQAQRNGDAHRRQLPARCDRAQRRNARRLLSAACAAKDVSNSGVLVTVAALAV